MAAGQGVMEINDQNRAALADYLWQTLNPITQKQAEQYLLSVEGQRNFPILVLQLVASEQTDPTLRFAASVLFKNYIKRNWDEEEDSSSSKISIEDRLTIKDQLVNLMTTVPERIQIQLSEALTVIANYDFPQRWESLLPQMVQKLNPDDFTVNNGILQTAHSIFKRWRPQFRSDELFYEIKLALGQFAEPYLQLFRRTDELIDQQQNNGPALKTLAQTLQLLIKIFYDFNAQDLPEFFEDNMTTFMDFLFKYIQYSNPLLVSDDDKEAGPLERIKAGICEIVELYAQNYDEDFPMLPRFVESIWQLVTTTSQQPKYDVLVSKAMAFLTSAAKQPKHRDMFGSDAVLQQLCEKIAVANMVMRESDEELFEDDPMEYIRRDLEGSDSETRRRAAADFLRGLLEQFEPQITSIIQGYIDKYMRKYTASPEQNWKDKDTAIFLMTAIATRSVTTQFGTAQTNQFVDVVQFFSDHIIGILQSDINSGHPILRVDALKYLYTFRTQLTKEQLLTVFPLLVNHLQSSNYVVYTYAAITIERVLYITHQRIPVFTKDDIRPYAQQLLQSLFAKIERDTSPEKLAENDYLMRAVMRVIIISREDIAPYANAIITELSNITAVISKNPSNPRFNHYVFDSIGALIRFICPNNQSALAEFEAALFPQFQTILAQDVQEFTPYVFQLMAQLLEMHTESGLPTAYQQLVPPLLQPSLWEQHGNIPALARLVQALLTQGASTIVANRQLEAILGIFQKLISSRSYDYYGFDLLTALIEKVPMSALQSYLPSVHNLVLMKLMKKVEPGGQSIFDKFTKGFIYYVTFFASLNNPGCGPEAVVAAFDVIQPNLFLELLKIFILPNVPKISTETDRKVAEVGLIRLLTECPVMLNPPNVTFWPQILKAIVKLFESAPQDEQNAIGDDLYTLDLEESGYQAGFSRLATVAPRHSNSAVNVQNPKALLAQGLVNLSQSRPSFIPSQSATLDDNETAAVNSYLTANQHPPLNQLA